MLCVGASPIPRYRFILYVAGGIALALLSATIFSHMTFFGVWPDVMTLYALFFTLYSNERGRYLPCMALGLMRDLFSAGPLGTYAILYGLLWRLLAPRRNSIFYRENPVILALVAAGVVMAVNLAYHCSMVLIGAGIGWTEASGRAVMIGLASAPLMPLLSYLLKVALRRLHVERLPGGLYNV